MKQTNLNSDNYVKISQGEKKLSPEESNLLVFEKTYEYLKWVYPKVSKFPKSQRFVLGQQIQNTVIDMLDALIEANTYSKRRPYVLQHASVLLNRLRILMRLAKDFAFVSIKQYGHSCILLATIGNLLGGYMKR